MGEKSTARTAPACAFNTEDWPSLEEASFAGRSQSSSQLLGQIHRHTQPTQSSVCVDVSTGTHALGTQRRTVRSFDPEASNPFCALNATECTAACEVEPARRETGSEAEGVIRARAVPETKTCRVSGEAIRPETGLEVPEEQCAVVSAGDELSHVGVEDEAVDAAGRGVVASECPL